jgi:fluoride exporter
MNNILWIGIGGFAGAVARYWLSSWVQNATKTTLFPYGTLTVNLLGCLLIGFLFSLPTLHRTLDAELRLLLITGFLGAFTTFSTFGNETLRLLQAEQTTYAFLYIALSLLLGIGAVRLGQLLAQVFS